MCFVNLIIKKVKIFVSQINFIFSSQKLLKEEMLIKKNIFFRKNYNYHALLICVSPLTVNDLVICHKVKH